MVNLKKPTVEAYFPPLVRRSKNISTQIMSHVYALSIGVASVYGGDTINSNGICEGNTRNEEVDDVKEEYNVV